MEPGRAVLVTDRAVPMPRLSRRAERSLRAAFADALESRRLIVLVPFGLVVGLALYAGLSHEPDLVVVSIVGAALGLAVLALAAHPVLEAMVALAFSIACGFLLLPLHGWAQGTPMLAFPAFGTYEARVDEVLSETASEARIVVSQLVPLGEARPLPIVRARLFVRGDHGLRPGDIVRANMRFAPVPGPILPNGFDNQFHAYFSGIGAFGSVTSAFERVAAGDPSDPARIIDVLRRDIAARISAHLPPDTASIAVAMIVGDQSGISDETREVMADSGLAHIYSISGLHLSIVAGGVLFLARFGLALLPQGAHRVPIKPLAAIVGILAATLYLLLAGGLANIPALRSTIMLVLVFGAVLIGRRALTMRNVAIAAILIILIDPSTVFRASFQLSFAAVVALIGIYEMPRVGLDVKSEERPNRLWTAVWVTAWTSAIAGGATLLFSAYHFQQTAPLGVLGNVLVLPVLTFVIMPFGVVSVLAMPFGAEAPFVLVLGWGIDRMLDIAVMVTAWSAGLQLNPLLAPSALAVGLAALAWFAVLRSWWRFAGPALALPVVLVFCQDRPPDVLIADSTQALALREDGAMGLMAGRTGTFATEVWGDTYAIEIAPGLDRLRCDSIGCTHEGSRFSVALSLSADSLAEDCPAHDLVVTRGRAPSTCRASAEVVDADDLRDGGVHWLAWNDGEGGFERRPAIPNPDRPWRP